MTPSINHHIYMHKGLTVIEVLIVIIIVGILVSLVLGSFAAQVEKFRSKEAETNLLAIYNAEKRYQLTHARYYVCAPNCTLKNINDNLSLAIHGIYYFNYSIIPFGPGNEGYRVVAKRKSGKCYNQTMNLTYTNSTLTRGCKLW